MSGKSSSEMLAGVKGPAFRINTLLPEAEFRYLYVVLTEHESVSDTGKKAVDRLVKAMGKTLDAVNAKRSRT